MAGSPTFHLFLPQMRMPVEAIVERALAAEAAGFEGIAFMDHLVPPLAAEHDMWEAMTIAGWVLARTSTLTVGHLVLCDALRHPAVLARQAVTLDHASGGRFELGIGWGSTPEELETFGAGSTAARDRVDRLAESLTVLRGLWTGEPVDHKGTYFTLNDARQLPVPLDRIPITIGGVGRRTLQLVQAHADWWNIPLHELSRLDDLRPHAGKTKISAQVMVVPLPSESARAEATARFQRRFGTTRIAETAVIGTPAELTAHFHALHAQGIDRFYLWFADFAPVETLTAFSSVIGSS
ncbi:LLM class flavin-dependent oxidoreductase [Actinocorallia longicatena]|uniref:LLM class flavin-dependent oxidoreductase n=1 Tax=Actinocorallia longicatena TaxID=111803 RepID=A0ABP6QDL4_9ACTN